MEKLVLKKILPYEAGRIFKDEKRTIVVSVEYNAYKYLDAAENIVKKK